MHTLVPMCEHCTYLSGHGEAKNGHSMSFFVIPLVFWVRVSHLVLNLQLGKDVWPASHRDKSLWLYSRSSTCIFYHILSLSDLGVRDLSSCYYACIVSSILIMVAKSKLLIEGFLNIKIKLRFLSSGFLKLHSNWKNIKRIYDQCPSVSKLQDTKPKPWHWIFQNRHGSTYLYSPCLGSRIKRIEC